MARKKVQVMIGEKKVYITGDTLSELLSNYKEKLIGSGMIDGARKRGTPFIPYAEKWLEIYKKNKVRITTYVGYESYLNVHLTPAFREKNIEDLTTEDIQMFLNEKKNYSKKTIQEIWQMIRSVLDVAVEDGIVNKNVARSIKLSNPSKKKTKRRALTTEEVEDVESHIKDIKDLTDRRYLAMLIWLPVRCEDIRGLQIKDIDLEKNLIEVRQSVTYANARTVIDLPKTEAGLRKMLLLPRLRELLELSEKEIRDPEAYLIHMRGDPYKPLTFQANRRLWERVRSQVEVYGATPHYFRHTFATRAHRLGISEKTLQSMGGWADIQTLRNVYIHTQEEDYETARKQLIEGFEHRK